MSSIIEIADQLTKHGWMLDLPNAAIKFYDTCSSGGSDAVILLYPDGRLHATFYSEGNNVVSTVTGSISKDISAFGGVDGDVNWFLVEVEKRIKESYGCRTRRIYGTPKSYRSLSAKEAQAAGYGKESYWDYLEQAALENHNKFLARGDAKQAKEYMTRSLSDSLKGNNGD